MQSVLLVAVGGAIGAVGRHLLSGVILSRTINSTFPFPTFTVNILGCFVAGLLLAMNERYALLHGPLRILLFTGILGGFTTFSAFGLETVSLIKRGLFGTALLYSLGSVVAGVIVLYGALIVFGPGTRE